MRKISLILYVVTSIGILLCHKPANAQPCKVEKHTAIPNLNGLTYHKARAKLLSAGWQPYQTISNVPTQQESSMIRYGNGEEFWKRGYREVEECAGTGVAPCSFLFTDVYKNRLRVTTAGEEAANGASVTGWSFVCVQQ